jgi:hypothetical protein
MENMVYNYSVELQYQKEGSELWEVETVNGQANLTEDYKIEGMVKINGRFNSRLYCSNRVRLLTKVIAFFANLSRLELRVAQISGNHRVAYV